MGDEKGYRFRVSRARFASFGLLCNDLLEGLNDLLVLAVSINEADGNHGKDGGEEEHLHPWAAMCKHFLSSYLVLLIELQTALDSAKESSRL